MELAEINKKRLKDAMNDLHKMARKQNSTKLAEIYGTISGCLVILTDCEMKFDEEITNG